MLSVSSTSSVFQRVELFRERVTSDKKSLGIIRPGDLPSPSTYITIHRPRLLADGHEQLATLTTKALKSTIRVKFVNEQVGEGRGWWNHGRLTSGQFLIFCIIGAGRSWD